MTSRQNSEAHRYLDASWWKDKMVIIPRWNQLIKRILLVIFSHGVRCVSTPLLFLLCLGIYQLCRKLQSALFAYLTIFRSRGKWFCLQPCGYSSSYSGSINCLVAFSIGVITHSRFSIIVVRSWHGLLHLDATITYTVFFSFQIIST